MRDITEQYEATLEEMNNAKEVLRLLRELKKITIHWFDDRGYSGRAIANQMGMSNTRVSQIIKTVKIL